MITKNGYVVNSEEEWYNEILDSMKRQFPNMSENPANLLVVLSRIMARNENRRDYDIVQRYSNAYVSTATGMHLDKAVRTAGIARLIGRKSTGKVKLIKSDSVAQIIFPANTIIKSSDLEYMTTNTSTIIINNKETEIEIVATVAGAIYNIPNASKFTTIQNIKGIDSIVAVTEIAGATNTETDRELRDRYYKRMAGYTNSSLRGIIDAVSSISDVLRVDGEENQSNTTVGSMAPHSFSIYVNGGTEKEIAEAIMNTKPAGIMTNGDITVQVQIKDRNYDIRFSRFNYQNVYYDLEIVIDRASASSNFIDNLKKEIIAYTVNNASIVGYELSNHISQSLPEVKGIRKMFFGLSPNPTTGDTITSQIGKIFSTDESKINVVVV